MRQLIFPLTVLVLACGGGSQQGESAGGGAATAGGGTASGTGGATTTTGIDGGAGLQIDGGLGGGDGGPDSAIAASEPEPEPEPAPSGPAQLTVNLTVGGEKVSGAEVRVTKPSGEEVAKGSPGETFTVPAGRYILQGNVTDESVLANTPEKRTASIVLSAQEERTETIEFGRSRVKLKVMRGNRHISGAKVALRRQGSEKVVLEYQTGDEFVPVSPGRYDATVRFGRTKVQVDGIVFQGGAQQEIPIRVQ